jgi:hypothetical protein
MAKQLRTKWAVEPVRDFLPREKNSKTVQTTTNLDDIHDATTDERLLERAMLDFVQEFTRHVVHGKTPRQAIAELDSWRNLFEKIRSNRHDPVF